LGKTWEKSNKNDSEVQSKLGINKCSFRSSAAIWPLLQLIVCVSAEAGRQLGVLLRVLRLSQSVQPLLVP
jgi:hypothetical protein